MVSRLPMPPEIAAVYLDFDWDKRELWALELQRESIERRLLDWHLDLRFWSSEPPKPLFDLVPRRVLEDPSIHPVHARRIRDADLAYPMHVMEHRGRLCIMDGMHRLAKAVREGWKLVDIRRVPPELLRPPRSTGA